MDNNTHSEILFEHPLNEQIRAYLRLEQMFEWLDKLIAEQCQSSHRAALHELIDLLDAVDRGDLKAELIKDLEQQSFYFERLRDNPHIDDLKLGKFLQQLQQLRSWLQSLNQKFGQRLRESHFLDSVKNRIRMPGASCSFDLPELHYFLQLDYETRAEQFDAWMAELDGLRTCIKVLLRLLRENKPFEERVAMAGFLEFKMPDQQVQLLRVSIAANAGVYPEISASKHRGTIRFLSYSGDTKPSFCQDDISCQLAIC